MLPSSLNRRLVDEWLGYWTHDCKVVGIVCFWNSISTICKLSSWPSSSTCLHLGSSRLHHHQPHCSHLGVHDGQDIVQDLQQLQWFQRIKGDEVIVLVEWLFVQLLNNHLHLLTLTCRHDGGLCPDVFSRKYLNPHLCCTQSENFLKVKANPEQNLQN